MAQDQNKLPVEVKDLYKTLIDTRNLEINLFWQRSNYFLVLNTGIAFGFFNLKESKYVLTFAVMGLLASLLWFWVCLGSKFWQARWERRLLDFEKEQLPGIEFFSATPERIWRVAHPSPRVYLKQPRVPHLLRLLQKVGAGSFYQVAGFTTEQPVRCRLANGKCTT